MDPPHDSRCRLPLPRGCDTNFHHLDNRIFSNGVLLASYHQLIMSTTVRYRLKRMGCQTVWSCGLLMWPALAIYREGPFLTSNLGAWVTSHQDEPKRKLNSIRAELETIPKQTSTGTRQHEPSPTQATVPGPPRLRRASVRVVEIGIRHASLGADVLLPH